MGYSKLILYLFPIILLLITYILVRVPSFPDWLGFDGKSLWDLMDLAIIPLSLVVVTFFFNRWQRQNEREVSEKQRQLERDLSEEQRALERILAQERESQPALQNYFDRITELLLSDKPLPNSDRAITSARARTLAVLHILDAAHKGYLLRFIYEADLINKENPIINLNGANLRQIELIGATLSNANLEGVDLREANLERTEFQGVSLAQADLRGAHLRAVNFTQVDLQKADLRQANLVAATLVDVNVKESDFRGTDLQGAKVKALNQTQIDFQKADLEGTVLDNIEIKDT